MCSGCDIHVLMIFLLPCSLCFCTRLAGLCHLLSNCMGLSSSPLLFSCLLIYPSCTHAFLMLHLTGESQVPAPLRVAGTQYFTMAPICQGYLP